MKQILTVPHKDRININEIEPKVRNARQSNDYILVNFGNRGQWIKIAFCKDQTYVIGYNFMNMEFIVKLNYMMKQYPRVVIGKLSAWLTDWVNKLNR